LARPGWAKLVRPRLETMESPVTTPASSDGRSRPAGGRLVLALVVGVLVVAAGVAYAGSGWVRHQVGLSVSHRPEPFTALYFTHPRDLPRLVAHDQTDPIEVTVADHDGARPDHVLLVEVSAANLTVPVAQRAFRLRPNGKQNETFDFVLPRPNLVYNLIFTLDGSEHLHWRVLST
jgi:hypothetical protein